MTKILLTGIALATLAASLVSCADTSANTGNRQTVGYYHQGNDSSGWPDRVPGIAGKM